MDSSATEQNAVPGPFVDGRVTGRDGRTLAYAEWGDPMGTPVVLNHGSPDTRLSSPDTDTDGPTSADRHVRLIMLDRPGYGRSDPKPDLTLLGWVDDLVDVIDALSIERFALVSVSGGGPYALAAAYRLPDRIMTLGLVSSPGPPGLGLPTTIQWAERERAEQLLRSDPSAVVPLMEERERWLIESPEAMVNPANWPENDRWVFDRPDRAPRWVEGLREASHQGLAGDVWDWIARNRDWGFTPADIAVRTLIWHGEDDRIVPVEHFNYLASTIPAARATLWEPGGHLAFLRSARWAEVLDDVTAEPH